MFVSLVARGMERREFFQVLVVDAASIEAAKTAVARYFERQGRRLLDFDEEETGVVQLERVKLPRVDANPEGVVAASGTIWVDPN